MNLEKNTYGEADVKQNLALAILANFGILFILYYIAAPKSEFVRDHANHGAWMTIASVASAIISLIPVVGQIISYVISLAVLVVFILGIVSATSNSCYKLPFIDDYKIVK